MKAKYLVSGLLFLALLMPLLAPAQEEVARISPEETAALLDSPDVTIIDVRALRDWNSGDAMIRGAIRRDPAKARDWGRDLDRDREIILYCA
nr:rhodanese-like domain-containing protein [Pseudodesulfovibrio tunisiensis]